MFVSIAAACVIGGILWDAYAVKTHMWNWPTECCNLGRLPGNIPAEEIVWMVSDAFYMCTITIVTRDVIVTHRKLKRRT